MISDEERREVAARLRYEESADPGCLNMIGEWYLISFLQSIDKAVDNGTEYRLRERLADLIDRPTCKNEGDEWGFLCSNCGEDVAITKEIPCGGAAAPYVPSYCPNCGAEVMDE